MNKLIQFIKNNFVQFLKFELVGISNTVVSYGVYFLLVRFANLHYITANIAAFVLAVLNSFYWNNRFVFKGISGKTALLKALLKLYITNIFTGVLLSNTLLYVEVDIIHISKYIAPLINIVIITPFNFLISKFWAFKKQNIQQSVHQSTIGHLDNETLKK